MRVFAQLSNSSRPDYICRVINERRQLVVGQGVWSTAELHLDSEDYEWFSEYISRLDFYTLDELLNSFDGANLGLVLLVYEAEVGRRESTEGELWASVYRRMPKSVRELLFLRNGQPNSKHKAILESAARRWSIRHVFGQEGVHEWINSVYLQFGFTHKGFSKRLPEWLVSQGNRPVAIEKLLVDSKSFQKLWRVLKEYSRGNIRAENLQEVLNSSPWVLPEWHRELLEVAARKARYSGADIEEEPFLSKPRIVWDDECYFTTELINLTEIGLVENEYIVNLDGKRVAKLLKQEDGSYYTSYLFGDSIRIELQEEAYISITDRQGVEQKSMLLELFRREDEITAYRYGATKVALEDLNRDSAYILIVNDDIELSSEVRKYEAVGVKALLLEKGWSTDTRVLIAGEELCQLKEYITERPKPEWAQSIRVYPKGAELHLQKDFYVKVKHPEGVQVVSARCAGVRVRPTERAKGRDYTDLGPFRLSFNTASEKLWIDVRLRMADESYVLKSDLAPNFTDAMFKSGTDEIELDGLKPLSAHQLASGQIKFFPSIFKKYQLQPYSEWCLIQGRRWITRPISVMKTHNFARSLVYLGASLKLIDGPYNGQNTIRLASSVINTGIVQSVKVLDSRVRIEMFNEVEPDEKHSVVLLSDANTFLKLSPESETKSVWYVEIPEEFRPVALAVAYNGECLGNWYSEEWTKCLNPLNEDDAFKAAWLLRWMELPILSNAVKGEIKRFFESYPKAVSRAWLSSYTECGLKLGDDEVWLLAMNKVLGYLTINHSTAIGIFEALKSSDLDPIGEFKIVAKTLIDIDPIIAGWVLQIVLKEVYLPHSSLRELRVLTETVKLDLGSESVLLKCCSEEMNVDDLFIKDSIYKGIQFFLKVNRPLEKREVRDKRVERNLTVSICNNRLYRQLLGIKILEEIEKKDLGRDREGFV